MKTRTYRISINLEENDLIYINSILQSNSATECEKKRARLLINVHNNRVNHLGLTEGNISKEEHVTYSTLENLKTKFNKTKSIEAVIKRKSYIPLASKEKIKKESKLEIIDIALSSPPKGKKRWSYRMICDFYNKKHIDKISHTTVATFLKDQKIQLKGY
ncbi:MAG: helix-turn-helix domain-containing protein [Spirochaetaceae bacterium]|nr:helix-turn-helix domain-containing protein [Spirochaetaceae bacterium]